MSIDQQIGGRLKLHLFNLKLRRVGNGSLHWALRPRWMPMTRQLGTNRPFQKLKRIKYLLTEQLNQLILPIGSMSKILAKAMKWEIMKAGATDLMNGSPSSLLVSNPSIARLKRDFLMIQILMRKWTVKSSLRKVKTEFMLYPELGNVLPVYISN